ncbi:AAA family ATPase [Paenisporosarcina quisquiliarum]|uniref:AAA family ATPase n=1 Tax=Paenisporosarcina quisquiliarum TaxID=365346 RepID=A0A9X3LIW6_9BACL|nr:AAA family ATPase [Paenisporosarcina quisquiliarum]MCZ8537279.1 AAA family ATPase [Paenisporosarcina quisquiliarum]
MLVNFRFGNFLSFNELSHFSMAIGNTRRHPTHVMKFPDISLLKFAVLYGANASGKSNLVKAIKFSKNLILKGVPDTITFDKYSKIDPSNKEKNTQFEYEIVIGKYVYSYGFSVNLFEKKISGEWLYSLKDNKEIEIFVREVNNDKNNFLINYEALQLNENDEMRLKVYTEDSKFIFNSLFITELNKNKQPLTNSEDISVFNLIYEWFENKLEVISPDESPSENGITYIKKDNGLALSNFLNAFGTGVKEVCTKEINEKDLYKEMPSMIVKKIIEKIKEDSETTHALLRTSDNIHEIEKVNNEIQIKTVTFKHSTENVFYTIGEESDGTVRLVEIYDILASNNEKVYVVDEIDRSLHPNLTYNYINEYLKKKLPGQLIVTTHEDRLLDFDMLRRDEIWFVEKQDAGDSKLYSLEKFKERFDKDILKAYLDGRYGSIPEFKFFNL